MNSAIKSLGYYKAVASAAVQYNSIVFRVVVGVLANVPVEIIAMITSIEFLLNFILEVPAGVWADKYGRVRLAILGHVTVILGLTCGYIGVLGVFDHQISYVLFILHGVFIGFTTPLRSGSVEAFYQSAAIKQSKNSDQDLLSKSLTISQTYGRYYTAAAILTAFGVIYAMHITIGSHHAFLLGILLWMLALIFLTKDYKKYGDENTASAPVMPMVNDFIKNKRLFASLLYLLSVYMLLASVLAYFIVAVGRFMDPNLTSSWVMIMLFMLSTAGFGKIINAFLLPKLIVKISEKNYLYFFYTLLLIAGLIMSANFPFHSNTLNYIAITLFGFVYYSSQSAIASVARNMAMSEVHETKYATILSLQNMPGSLFIGAHSFYIAKFRDGCPTFTEIFISMTIVSGLFIILHFMFYNPKSIVVEA